MSHRVAFGVIGGYGATGRNAVAELLRSTSGDILIGGRNEAKARAAATESDGRVSASRVDVLDPNSLNEFCCRCFVIVNCASPVMVLEDRVAQAAWQARCHYVDAASLLIVKDRMAPQSQTIKEAKLSFVMSAGWLPGMSELLPLYAHVLARTKMDAIESSTMYFGDTSDWSDNAFQEAAWLMRRLGQSRRGYFRKGEWVREGIFSAAREADLGNPIGRQRFYLFSNPELSEIGSRLNDCTLSAYACVPGLRTMVASSLISLFPISEKRAGRLLQNSFRKNRLPVGGFVVVQVQGSSQGRKRSLRVQLIYKDGKEYWINGVVPATVARMISDGQVQPGLNYLASAVDPLCFVAELRLAGVELAEVFEPAG